MTDRIKQMAEEAGLVGLDGVWEMPNGSNDKEWLSKGGPSEELRKFAALAAEDYIKALRQIIDLKGTEANEWDAVERLLPEIMSIAEKALVRYGIK